MGGRAGGGTDSVIIPTSGILCHQSGAGCFSGVWFVVILRYHDGAFRIAADFMDKPAPSRGELEIRAQQVREDTTVWMKGRDLPGNLLATTVDLIYSGHPAISRSNLYRQRTYSGNCGGKY